MKKNIAIVTGGYSGEVAISLQSGDNVFRQLDKKKYTGFLIVIEKNRWYYRSPAGEEVDVDRDDFSIMLPGRKILFDCVFIALHGTPGEDGRLQGYFDMLGIPYTSCGAATSSATFNKYYTNRIARSLGVHNADCLYYNKHDKINAYSVVDFTGLPCFVKPNNGGSSVGVTRVNSIEELPVAIKSAFREDDEIVIERYIKGTEVTCGVLSHFNDLFILPLTEIVSKKVFFDYEAKYTEGMADEITPARIPEKNAEDCRRLSAFLYHELNCQGLVRFDYILRNDDLYFLEVNTVPGLTPASIVPKMAKEMGMTMQELFGMMIEDAMWRAG